jgi:hypothetical protein
MKELITATMTLRRNVIYTDLDSLAGTWSIADAAEFAQATSVFEKVDEVMWRE